MRRVCRISVAGVVVLLIVVSLGGCAGGASLPPGRADAAIDALRDPLLELGRALDGGDLSAARRAFVEIGAIYGAL